MKGWKHHAMASLHALAIAVMIAFVVWMLVTYG